MKHLFAPDADSNPLALTSLTVSFVTKTIHPRNTSEIGPDVGMVLAGYWPEKNVQ